METNAASLDPIIPEVDLDFTSMQEGLINDILQGLRNGHVPTRCRPGILGSYYMLGHEGGRRAVFKPCDEEPGGLRNPIRRMGIRDGEGLKMGSVVGEGAAREVAAYILDRPRDKNRTVYTETGFCGVPTTILVKCTNVEGFIPKVDSAIVGSLQEYAVNTGDSNRILSGRIPAEEVPKIALLDIRFANTDRHKGNMLYHMDGDKITLIPIDHGYCFPTRFGDCKFDWMDWSQSKKPFSMEFVNYIKSLDVERDIQMIIQHGLDMHRDYILVFRASTFLLQTGVELGLSPHAIGQVMCRKGDKEAKMEQILEEVCSSIPDTTCEEYFKRINKAIKTHLSSVASSCYMKTFAVRDSVMVYLPAKGALLNHTRLQRRRGPFQIIHKVNDDYVVQIPSYLKRFIPSTFSVADIDALDTV